MDLDGAWGRPSLPQKCSVHAVSKPVGFCSRNAQVKVLILSPTPHVALVSLVGKNIQPGLVVLCRNAFPSSRFNVFSFILLRCVCHMLFGQCHCRIYS